MIEATEFIRKNRSGERLKTKPAAYRVPAPRLVKIKDGFIRTMEYLDHGFVKEVYSRSTSFVTEHGFIHKQNFIFHREDGHAIENTFNGTGEFYFNGFHIIDTQQYCFLCDMDEIETMMMVLKYGR